MASEQPDARLLRAFFFPVPEIEPAAAPEPAREPDLVLFREHTPRPVVGPAVVAPTAELIDYARSNEGEILARDLDRTRGPLRKWAWVNFTRANDAPADYRPNGD